MSLATRCIACGTVFRVVQDQLKVSEGWVRCGRCNEVFSALEGLFDLERDAPPDWNPQQPPAPAVHAPTSSVDLELGGIATPSSAEVVPLRAPRDDSFSDPFNAPFDAPAPGPAAHASAIDVPLDAPFPGPRREAESTPAMRIDERDRLEFPDAQFEPESVAAEPDGVSILLPLENENEPVPQAPDFVRHAQRRERWQSPWARAALGVVGVLLLAVLALQAGHHFRDSLAARWPVTKPALVAWCEFASCSIRAPKRIEDIAVESTALTRANAPDTFKLAVTLRNRGTTALALPAVDLSLTDGSGVLVARRMLAPSEFRTGTAVIGAGAELPMQLLLTTGNARVTGYTVEVFYP